MNINAFMQEFNSARLRTRFSQREYSPLIIPLTSGLFTQKCQCVSRERKDVHKYIYEGLPHISHCSFEILVCNKQTCMMGQFINHISYFL